MAPELPAGQEPKPKGARPFSGTGRRELGIQQRDRRDVMAVLWQGVKKVDGVRV
jgi:hypothetical protein